MGFPVTQMDCMVPRRPLGKPVFPKTPFKKWFPSTFPNFGKIGEGPPGPLWISYGPFVGSYPYPTPDQPPEVACMLIMATVGFAGGLLG